MILRLRNGDTIHNVKRICAIPDYFYGKIRYFAFTENEHGELEKIEISPLEMESFTITDDHETRFSQAKEIISKMQQQMEVTMKDNDI